MLAEASLSDFVRLSWPVIEPHTRYLHNWHIDCICEHLQAVDSGEITRLLVNIPPRYMKSTLISVDWPVWSWINDPGSRWLFASYSGALSMYHSIQRRTIIQSMWYQDRWASRYQLTTDQNVKTEYQNDRRGHMIASGLGGTVTGKGGNRVVVDDPHNPETAHSDAERVTALRVFDQTISTRLDDKRTGAIVVVMQRLHERDLAGHILSEIGGYQHVCLPAVADARTVVHFPVTGREVVREDGDLLWPGREGPEEIETARRQLGTYGFTGQYQQQPSPPGGGIFKRTWWQYWRVLPTRFDRWYQSWDCTFKDADDTDYVVGQVWGVLGGDRYLIDQVRARMNFVDTRIAIRAFASKWPLSRGYLIEGKANGPAVIASLRHEIAGLVEIEPEGGKVARARAIEPQVEAGNVYIPDPSVAPWVSDFLEETASFPMGAHDDQVDAMTQLLNYVGTGGAAIDDIHLTGRREVQGAAARSVSTDQMEAFFT